jgi:hypothetical protein
VKLSEVSSAARNLADYIDIKGDGADMNVVAAQVSLIVARSKEATLDKEPEMAKTA